MIDQQSIITQNNNNRLHTSLVLLIYQLILHEEMNITLCLHAAAVRVSPMSESRYLVTARGHSVQGGAVVSKQGEKFLGRL